MFRNLAIIFALSFLPPLAVAEDNLMFYNFLVGDYLLIGKALDSDETYTGKVRLYLEDDALKVHRTINGKTVTGNAALETALHGEKTVLRIRFTENKVKYEKTCLSQTDLDNYARLSCYLYQPRKSTKKPGLEALFYDHEAK